jgi:hypothetical protein
MANIFKKLINPNKMIQQRQLGNILSRSNGQVEKIINPRDYFFKRYLLRNILDRQLKSRESYLLTQNEIIRTNPNFRLGKSLTKNITKGDSRTKLSSIGMAIGQVADELGIFDFKTKMAGYKKPEPTRGSEELFNFDVLNFNSIQVNAENILGMAKEKLLEYTGLGTIMSFFNPEDPSSPAEEFKNKWYKTGDKYIRDRNIISSQMKRVDEYTNFYHDILYKSNIIDISVEDYQSMNIFRGRETIKNAPDIFSNFYWDVMIDPDKTFSSPYLPVPLFDVFITGYDFVDISHNTSELPLSNNTSIQLPKNISYKREFNIQLPEFEYLWVESWYRKYLSVVYDEINNAILPYKRMCYKITLLLKSRLSVPFYKITLIGYPVLNSQEFRGDSEYSLKSLSITFHIVGEYMV